MIRDSLVLVALCVCVIAVLSGPGIRSMDVDVDASHDYDYDSDSDYSHDYDVAYEHDEALDLDGGGFVPHQQAVKQQQQQQQQPQQVQQQHTFKVQLPIHQHQQALPIQPQPVKLLLPIQQQQPTQTYHLPIQQQQQQSLPIQHQTQTITATAAAALPIQTHAKLQSSPVQAAAATPALRVKQSLPIHLQQQLMPVQQQRLPIQQPHAKLMQQPSMPIQQAATAAAAAVQQKKVMPQLQQPVKMMMSSGSSSKKKVGAIATTLATTDFCALPLTQASSYNAATGMFHIELTPLSNIVPAAVDLHISKNCGGSTAAGMNVMHAKTTAVQQQQQSLPLQQKQQQQAIHTLGVAVGSVKSAAVASSSSLRVAQQQVSSKIGVKPSHTAEMCAQAFDQYYFDQPYSINLHAEATAAVTSAVMKQQLPIQQQAQLPIQQQSAAAAAVNQPTATIHFAAAGTGSTVARASSEGAQFAGNKFMFNVNLNDKPIMQTLNVGDHLCYAFTYLYEGGVGCNTNICSLPAPASCANVRYTASARFDASASKIHASFQPQTALIPTAVDLHITKNCVDAHSPLLTAMMNANTCSASGPASTSSIPYSRLQAPFGTPLALNVHANRVQPSQSSAGATFSPTTNEYHFQVSLPSDHPLRASLAQGDVLCYAFTYLLSDVGCDTGVCATNIAVPVAAVKQQPLQLPIQQAIKQQLPIQQAATVKQALPIQQQPIVAAIEQSMPIQQQQQAQAAAAAAVKQQQQPVQQQQQATAAVKQSLSIQQVQQAVQQAVHHQQQQTAAATAAAAKQSLPVQHQQQPVQQAAAVKQSLPIQQAAKQTVSLPVQQQASVGGAGAN